MQRVFVLDDHKNPLMPCTPARARELLNKGKAAVYKQYPFTIILKNRIGGETQPIQMKVDPGSKMTGIALVADFGRGKQVIWAAEIQHRGTLIANALESRRSLRRGRRNRHMRYRSPRWNNRVRAKGWLVPSARSRLNNVLIWIDRVNRYAGLTGLGLELVKFDTQLMENPDISGVEYQQGTLAGYEVREYLLEKWGRKCAYCGAENVPLEIEHIIPKSRGGSNRIGNLTIACHKCNHKKGAKTADEFGHPEIQKHAKVPLDDAAAVNQIRWALWRAMNDSGLDLETGSGGRTKFNRTKQGYKKDHWIDAACVGESGERVIIGTKQCFLYIKAQGRGSRQRVLVNKYGFPVSHRPHTLMRQGYKTGDMVAGQSKTKGRIVGRGVVDGNGMRIYVSGKRVANVCFKNCRRLQAADGYGYSIKK